MRLFEKTPIARALCGIEFSLIWQKWIIFWNRTIMQQIASRCGRSAIGAGATFTDPVLSRLCADGKAIYDRIEATKQREHQLSAEISSAKAQQSQSRITEFKAERSLLRTRSKLDTGELEKIISTLGFGILRLTPPDERFIDFYKESAAPNAAVVTAWNHGLRLKVRREQLGKALGTDIRYALIGLGVFIFLGLAIFVFALTGPTHAAKNAEDSSGSLVPVPRSLSTLVFIVPGTYGNDGFWPNVQDGYASFASELKRTSGPRSEIYPFLWDGSNDHSSRQSAAQQLAAKIDEKAPGFDRICLVGHSHGGNIALMAAGMCHSELASVICLSTPHVHLRTQLPPDGRPFWVPVYYSWDSEQHAKSVVCISPPGDFVSDVLANVFKGLDDETAVGLTTGWREHCEFPRLRDDSWQAHFFGTNENVFATSGLSFANNVTIRSLIPDLQRRHGALHSRRMGCIVGELLRDGISAERLGYLQTTVQPDVEDTGEPIPRADEDRWTQEHRDGFQRAAWWLREVKLHLDPKSKQVADNLDGTDPSPFIRITSADGVVHMYENQAAINNFNPTWNTDFVMWNGQREVMSVLAFHFAKSDTSLGRRQLTSDSSPISTLLADPDHGVYWSANLDWVPVHY